MYVLPSDLSGILGFYDGSVIGHYMFTDLQKDLIYASFASGLRKQVVCFSDPVYFKYSVRYKLGKHRFFGCRYVIAFVEESGYGQKIHIVLYDQRCKLDEYGASFGNFDGFMDLAGPCQQNITCI